ncbi:uncharacterized protein FA14DRAFT_117850 [Meira miltonrushii]|uniref:PH domain-containing protein n=1 Tax=Meira miltonrushii TaxID=1280837 RepID=A0A316VHN5_9BASI|nr:uncharacterized protein FA14DRAFT_117850 [Meira miltonrushii]PWN37056.1 hypothetical protein FA14DRAFT_117850 [Meira miltonrushii]
MIGNGYSARSNVRLRSVSTTALPLTDKHSSRNWSSIVNEALDSFRLLEALRNGDEKSLKTYFSSSHPTSGHVKELNSPLHLAVRCAEFNTIKFVLQQKPEDLNAVEEQNGNTALHLAASTGRLDVIDLFLSRPQINDTIRNRDGQDPMEAAQTIEAAKLFQISRAELNFKYQDVYERWENQAHGSDEELKKFLQLPRIGVVDLNTKSRVSGSTLLHDAVRRKDTQLIELAVRKGADVFVRNKRGKRVLETTKDEKIKALLQQLSNADAAMAANANQPGLPPTFRGYLGKWTNYARGYKNRWFVLENGILSYYHTQEEEGKQSRGSLNLRFAKIRADPSDKLRLEVVADHPSNSNRSGNRLYLRGSHPVERARWVQVLQHTVEYFDLDRNNSRAESVKSFSKDGTVSSANVPAGTPHHPPSRSTTPFRNIPSPGPGGLSGITTNILSRTGSTATKHHHTPSTQISQLKSPDTMAGAEFPAKTPSIMTRGSRTPSEDFAELDGAGSDTATQSQGVPFQNELPIVSNSIKTQLELGQQMVQSVNVSQTQQPEARSAVLEAMQTCQTLFTNYTTMVAEREAYILRRYEQEIQAKRLWEENIRTLAMQYAEMETQLQEAAEENARRRKALREVRDNYSNVNSPALSPVPPNMATPTRSSMANARSTIEANKLPPAAIRPSAQRGAINFDDANAGLGSNLSRSSVNVGAEPEDLDDDKDDEFFDAIESGNLPNLKVEEGVVETDTSAKPAGSPTTSVRETRVNSLWPGVEPYLRLRKKMPIGKDDRPSLSLWSVLKNNIGKDLTKISFPVSFNEPTSMLQRMAEDMTYASLLDTAVRQKESSLRMAFVAAFACSNYVTTLGRVAKPFNPMLGETFEYINLDDKCKYRYQSEQVSHHPPISACIAESLEEDGVHVRPAWEYSGCVQAQSKFLGRSFEIRPTGIAHVKLRVDGVEEHYTFKKVTTSVSGFVTGNTTIDHYGDMNIKCHTTGDECTMTFKPRGWRSSAMHELKGSVTNSNGNQTWEIAGRWSSQIVARRASGSTGATTMDPDGNVDSLSTDPAALAGAEIPEMVLLWKYTPQPPGPFNLTPYAIKLNDTPEGLHDFLPPTDCRMRPDLRLFERGQYDEADVMKRNLEEFQRATRKKREQGELPAHQPKFFSRKTDPLTQGDYWEPSRLGADKVKDQEDVNIPEYWVRRRHGQWEDMERIFGEYTA